MKSILVLIATVAQTSGFANGSFAASSPSSVNAAGYARQRTTSTLSASSLNESVVGKTFAASSMVAAYLLANVLSADVALAATPSDELSIVSSFAGDSSSLVMAARSGGRAGGRSMPRSMPRSSMGGGGGYGGGGRTVINRSSTTIVAPPIVMGGGFGYGGGYGYGYDPTPGLIFHGINAIGNGIRESRQNEMIYEERSELAAAREREAEMASRIRQLELMQAGGGAAVQPPITIIQPQAVPAQ